MARVLIVGGGRIGGYVAGLLTAGGDEVTIVEPSDVRLEALARNVPHATAVRGSGTDPTVLERAGVHGADVVVALTGADETNLVASSLARFEFDVGRTIARIVDPANAWMFTSVMGVDVALNQADLIGHLVAEEISLGEMTTLLKLRRGRYSLVEERVHPAAEAAGRAVKDIALPDVRLVAVLREGEPILTEGDTVLEPEDEVLAVVHHSQAEALARLLGPRRELG